MTAAHRHFRRVRGSILLETILALLFMVLTLGAVAGLFRYSLAGIRRSQLQTRAMLLAENVRAQLETGLTDITESNEGDFNGKPDKFKWKVELEPTQIAELQRMTITVSYDDPTDNISYSLMRLYSPSMNLSAEKMKEIAKDPVRMQALGSTSEGLSSLMSLVSEFPGGDLMIEALNRGGMFGFINIFNQVASGKIPLDKLLSAMTDAAGGSSGENPLTAILGKGSSNPLASDNATGGGSAAATPLVAWTNYDTAGIGRPPAMDTGLASGTTGQEATTQPAGEGGQPSGAQPETGRPGMPGGQPEPGTGTAANDNPNANEPPTGSQNRTMSRTEAMQRMTDILRRMANQGNRQR